MKFQSVLMIPCDSSFRFCAPWLVLVTMLLPLGCDLPDRPQLQSTIERDRINAEEAIEELDQAAVNKGDQLEIRSLTPGLREAYQVLTSPLAPGGQRIVGDRVIAVREIESGSRMDLNPPADYPKDTFLGVGFGDPGQLDASFVSDFESGVGLGEARIRVEERRRLLVQSGSAVVLRRLDIREDQRPDGKLIEFEIQDAVGPVVYRNRGFVDGDRLKVVDTNGREQSYAWESNDYGFYAVQQSLKSSPVQLDDPPRQIRGAVLSPGSVVLVRPPLPILLSPVGKAKIPDASGNVVTSVEIRESYRIDTEQTVSDVHWIGPSGDTIRTVRTAGLIEEPAAWPLANANGLPIGLTGSKAQKVTQALDELNRGFAWVIPSGIRYQPHQVKIVAYEIESLADDLKLISGPHQSLVDPDRDLGIEPASPIDRAAAVEFVLKRGQKMRLARHASGKRPKGFEGQLSDPSTIDLFVGGLADANSQTIRRIISATKIGADFDAEVGAEYRLAKRLLEATSTVLVWDRRPGPIRRASEVVNDGRGDSIAISTVLAALLRGNNIPARLALGLRFVEDDKQVASLQFGCWVAAHVDGKWQMFDPVRPDAALRTDRLLLTTSGLQARDLGIAINETISRMTKMKVRIAGAR